MNHIGESAELYALGALDDADAVAVRAHLPTCAQCREAVQRASQVVTALSEPATLQQPSDPLRARILSAASREPVSARRTWFLSGIASGLAAAAILIALIRVLLPSSSGDEVALQTLVHSHFSHVAFAAKPGAPAAKLLYGRHGEWIFVIADDARPLHVLLGTSPGNARDVGALRKRGNVETLYLANPPPFTYAYLADRHGPLTQARPAFAK